MSEWHELNPIEKERVYYFKSNGSSHSGRALYLTNVRRIKVSASGNHYLESDSGKYIVAAGTWEYISIDTDAWTF